VLTAQQIVSKVKTPDHIQASTRNADRGNRVMVHGNDSKGSNKGQSCFLFYRNSGLWRAQL
jgi:hypothetical protein